MKNKKYLIKMQISMINDASKGLLLIFLAIICNYLGDTMNCSIQYALFKHPIIKWLVVLGLIYFTINFTSSGTTNPSWLFINSFVVFIIFILFMKQHIITFYISLLLLIVIFSANQYLTYYENMLPTNPNLSTKVSVLQKTLLILEIILIIILLSGNMIYLSKQYSDHKDNFSLSYFYFGTNKCSSIEKQQQQATAKKLLQK
jgi:hypothetical protein